MDHSKQFKVYKLLTVSFAIMAVIMLFIPDKEVAKELAPRSVIKLYNHGNAFYSTDKVAEMIMQGNPALQLVDVRTEAEFNKFSLKGAINIPLDTLLSKDERGNYVWRDYLKPDKKITVFYSNGDMQAAEAWTLATRLHFKNIFILEGGLNNWVETILKPQAPDKLTALPDDYKAYEFRKAASLYFGGGSAIESNSSSSQTQSAQPVIKKKKEKSEGGGC
jgi:rhodanese-related sulfurtransferase